MRIFLSYSKKSALKSDEGLFFAREMSRTQARWNEYNRSMDLDARRWNERYQQEREEWVSRPVRPLLKEHAFLLPQEGTAFVAAAGVGTNALFLAERGLRVLAADISFFAMQTARQRAGTLPLLAAVMDLSRLTLPPSAFEVILNFYFLERALFPIYQRALKPKGILFFETFLAAPDSKNESHYLQPGELLAAWQGFEILHHRVYPRKKRRTGSARFAEQLIVRKDFSPHSDSK